MKNKTGEHVPPPRPKRKSANPYPHKAPESLPSTIKSTPPSDIDAKSTAQKPAQEQPAPPSSGAVNGRPAGPPFQREELGNQSGNADCRLPNFAEVYRALGELFDPSSSGSEETLFRLPPMEKETLALLSRNLTANLYSKQVWEDQMQIVNQPPSLKSPPQEYGGTWQVKRGNNRLQSQTGQKQKSKKGKTSKKKSKESARDDRGQITKH
mmetsp:Transcript_978/g.6138  ORF Transcript_978/g.6138 Transcript_978/m.6138 type:complete len:210 (-) Transcript_978:901-1530(-)